MHRENAGSDRQLNHAAAPALHAGHVRWRDGSHSNATHTVSLLQPVKPSCGGFCRISSPDRVSS
jgi:hypothetical protein